MPSNGKGVIEVVQLQAIVEEINQQPFATVEMVVGAQPGPPGPPGQQGEPGAGIAIVGTVPSAADLPASANPGDMYIAGDTGHGWVWDDAPPGWTDVGQIAGPAGVGVPAGGIAGQLLLKASAADYDTAWGSTATKTFRTTQTFAVMGELAPALEIPGAFQSMESGQSSSLLEVIHRLEVGTATVQVRRDGVAVGTDLNVSAAKETTALGVALADGDYVDLYVAEASAATDLSLSLVMRHIV